MRSALGWEGTFSKLDQSGFSRREAGTVEVQGSKLLSEIDVQPFTPSIASFSGADCEHVGCYAEALTIARHHCVQNEGTERAIPGDVDKPDQLFVSSRADPPEAVSVHSSPPIIVEDTVMKCLAMQPVYGLVAEFAAPEVRDIHTGRVLVPLCDVIR